VKCSPTFVASSLIFLRRTAEAAQAASLCVAVPYDCVTIRVASSMCIDDDLYRGGVGVVTGGGGSDQQTPPWQQRLAQLVIRFVMRSLQLRFDFDSTPVRLLVKGHQGHSDVTRAADPLAAVTLTCLFI